MLPDFIICGAAKSGTTSLHHMLMNHPSLCMPMANPQKNEIHFFDNEVNYANGQLFYENFFASCAKGNIIGQTAPSYMFLDYVPHRIYKLLPQVKLIFILRNPVERAYSQYLTKVFNGREKHSFTSALGLEKKRIKKNHKARLTFSYMSRGLYSKQIEHFLNYFSMKQMFFLLTEDLSDPEQDRLTKLQTFLGVQPILLKRYQKNRTKYVFNHKIRYFVANNPIFDSFPKLRSLLQFLNVTNQKPPMYPTIKRELQDIFAEPNKNLSKIIGYDLSHWDIKN